ncbi:MAG: glycoside hydrolase family 38 C-terminal domain-containing protein, partial [Armatimonadota bacterium]
MTLPDELSKCFSALAGASEHASKLAHRIQSELRFAAALAQARPDQRTAWEELIAQASHLVASKVSSGGTGDLEAAVQEAEKLLAPIGQAAKEYTIHCVGHAHIDMNWMWSWPETVATTNDTFTTVDRLMDEFPAFRFSQSQASTYLAMEQHCPEVFEMIKRRVSEGRWEVTASMWVEGDKNLANGEILCRHLLHTKRYFRDRFGLPYDAVKIDWEPDLFGHAHTIPAILTRAGVRRYYFCRTGPGPRLFWWQAPDGSKVIAFDDGILWYNGEITTDMTRLLFEFEKATGLKDYLFVYGVGDHGGGPTRRDLCTALEMDSWPIWPNVRLSTTEEFFSIAEQKAPDLPVVNQELGYVFEGCYTSQSNIKRANRLSENALAEAEIWAITARGLAGLEYPIDRLHEAWRNAMFNQFHDILPGSGVHATYEYAQGLFQEIMVAAEMVKTRCLRRIAGRVNTAALVGTPPSGGLGAGVGPGIGAGPGDSSLGTGVTARGAGALGDEPLVVFNPCPWVRSGVVLAKVWDKRLDADRIVVKDQSGVVGPAQVVERGHYWGHTFTTLAFPARDVPGVGYRTFAVAQSVEPVRTSGASADASGWLENEFLRVQVDQPSGAVTHLIDKATGYDFVPSGSKLGMLVFQLEAPHGMTAWDIGQIISETPFVSGATLHVAQSGPHAAVLRSSRKYRDSRFTLDIALFAGVPWLEFVLNVEWLERGSPEIGVPMLRVVFPVAVAEPRATYEIPFGSIVRPTNGHEVPALRWA